jgi:3-phosphoshikimate 1-carboxyvinyltransferase
MNTMNMKISPQKLSGEIEAITSKSAAHRALICAFLCGQETVKIDNTSNDIEATINCLSAMKDKKQPVINCRESGSTFRFLLPLSVVLCDNAKFIGEGRLPERPIADLLNALKINGAEFSSDILPFEVSGKLRSGEYVLPGNVSSQFVSGLLFALPLLDGDSIIRLTSRLESKAYADITVNMLRNFGVEITEENNNYIIKGKQTYKAPKVINVEKDWSNAAFFLAAGVKVTGLDLNSAQGDREIVNILKQFETEKNLEIDVSEIPDLLPILAVSAAVSQGKTILYNAARLRLKESDRLSAVSEMLNNFNVSVIEETDRLIITGGRKLRNIKPIDSKGDHRIVMSAAICACYCENETIINNAEAVEKSYPKFFEDFRKLGGECHVI